MSSRREISAVTRATIIGSTLGILAVLLMIVKYNTVIISNNDGIYALVVAAVFLGIGVWAGRKVWAETTKEKAPLPESAAPETSAYNPQFVSSEQNSDLTDRELEVLAQMASGRTNPEIASEMYVSVNTVKTHASNIFSKLGVARRVQAIQRAQELGLITQVDEKR